VVQFLIDTTLETKLFVCVLSFNLPCKNTIGPNIAGLPLSSDGITHAGQRHVPHKILGPDMDRLIFGNILGTLVLLSPMGYWILKAKNNQRNIRIFSNEVRPISHTHIPYPYTVTLMPISVLCLSLARGLMFWGFASNVWNMLRFVEKSNRILNNFIVLTVQ
jgi:hypothetical protein